MESLSRSIFLFCRTIFQKTGSHFSDCALKNISKDFSDFERVKIKPYDFDLSYFRTENRYPLFLETLSSQGVVSRFRFPHLRTGAPPRAWPAGRNSPVPPNSTRE